jgi:hypothetical protein
MEETEDGELTADGSRFEKLGHIRKGHQHTLSLSGNWRERLDRDMRRSLASETAHRRLGSLALGTPPQRGTSNVCKLNSNKLMVKQEDYLMKVLQEAECLAYEPKRVNLPPALDVKLASVTVERTATKLSLISLLSALRFDDPNKEVNECENEEELAERVIRHVSGLFPTPRDTSRPHSVSGLDKMPADDPQRIIHENKRMKGVIHKLQNEKNAFFLKNESERNQNLMKEVENLKRQIADLVDLLKRKENEPGCSILLLKEKSQDKFKKNFSRTSTPRTSVMPKAQVEDWQSVLTEQKATITNLSSLVENLRLENEVLLGRLRLADTVQAKFSVVERSEPYASTPGKSYGTSGHEIHELRSKIRSISRSHSPAPHH